MKLVGAGPDGIPDGNRPKEDRAHAHGIHHFSAHLLVARDGVALTRRRGPAEARYRGLLTTTLGGAVVVDGSADDALRTAGIRFGIVPGALRYVGTFEVRDEEEQETCTLWTTDELDTSRTSADLVPLPLHDVDPHRCTPHLYAAIERWREGRC